MKKLLSILLLLTASARGADTLLWDASPTATGYKVYAKQGTSNVLAGTSATNGFSITNASLTYGVSATNQNGESVINFVPAPVLNIRVILQGSASVTGPFTNTVTAAQFITPTNVGFYRGLVEIERK